MFGENAVLTAIKAPGTPDDYGDVATAGTAVWTGSVPCYLRRTRRRVMSAGAMTLLNADQLFVRRTTGAPVLEIAGDQLQGTTVSVTDNRTGTPVSRSFRVVAVDNRAGGTSVDAVRLELDDER